ncbi:phage tail protein [Aeromonas hydrophila]|uniref:phage tail protein n=1 Tax=Aeromonas hydrophila TaxID=644 RepID=UPI00207C52C5|nr:phage tail protein [Aeromonas hydrophila]MCO4207930.1 phage tail protein [Aeromonas hydrophila]
MNEAMNEQQAQGYFLHALHAEIQRVLPAKCHKSLDSWMENGAIRLESKNMGPTGVDVAWLTYQAVYTIEQLPFRELDPAIVLATVAAWVQENDPFRGQFGLDDPEYAVTPNDERTADLEIQLTFTEPLRLIEHPSGPIHWSGKRWNVAPYDIWVAEHIEMNVGDTGHHQVGGQS